MKANASGFGAYCRCSCCQRGFSEFDWHALPVCARPGQSQTDAAAAWATLGLDGRNCPSCNSTLCLEVT